MDPKNMRLCLFRSLQVFLKIKVIFVFHAESGLRDPDHTHFNRYLFSLLTQMQRPLEGRGMAWKTWADYSFQWETVSELVKTLMHLKML